jgi:hypothetical protein
MFIAETYASKPVGLPWYKRADYARLRQIMVDGEEFPPSFDRWQRRAEDSERRLKADGRPVVRVHIDPQEFVAWCATAGRTIDRDARIAFANPD